MNQLISLYQIEVPTAEQHWIIQGLAKQPSKPQTPEPKGPKPPNWPSKQPGKPSGPGRDNNPPKQK